MSAIEIKHVRPRVEELLSRYESAIGADFPGYRNHVYRTITYAMHFLDGAAEGRGRDLPEPPTPPTPLLAPFPGQKSDKVASSRYRLIGV